MNFCEHCICVAIKWTQCVKRISTTDLLVCYCRDLCWNQLKLRQYGEMRKWNQSKPAEARFKKYGRRGVSEKIVVLTQVAPALKRKKNKQKLLQWSLIIAAFAKPVMFKITCHMSRVFSVSISLQSLLKSLLCLLYSNLQSCSGSCSYFSSW